MHLREQHRQIDGRDPLHARRDSAVIFQVDKRKNRLWTQLDTVAITSFIIYRKNKEAYAFVART
jgi:hypothetical protein